MIQCERRYKWCTPTPYVRYGKHLSIHVTYVLVVSVRTAMTSPSWPCSSRSWVFALGAPVHLLVAMTLFTCTAISSVTHRRDLIWFHTRCVYRRGLWYFRVEGFFALIFSCFDSIVSKRFLFWRFSVPQALQELVVPWSVWDAVLLEMSPNVYLQFVFKKPSSFSSVPKVPNSRSSYPRIDLRSAAPWGVIQPFFY